MKDQLLSGRGDVRRRYARAPRGRSARLREPEHVRDRGFFRLRRMRAASFYSGRQSRNSRKLHGQLQDRQLELSALETDLQVLSMYDPAAKNPGLVADERFEPFLQARGCR